MESYMTPKQNLAVTFAVGLIVLTGGEVKVISTERFRHVFGLFTQLLNEKSTVECSEKIKHLVEKHMDVSFEILVMCKKIVDLDEMMLHYDTLYGFGLISMEERNMFRDLICTINDTANQFEKTK